MSNILKIVVQQMNIKNFKRKKFFFSRISLNKINLIFIFFACKIKHHFFEFPKRYLK